MNAAWWCHSGKPQHMCSWVFCAYFVLQYLLCTAKKNRGTTSPSRNISLLVHLCPLTLSTHIFLVVQLKSNNPFCWHLSEIIKKLQISEARVNNFPIIGRDLSKLVQRKCGEGAPTNQSDCSFHWKKALWTMRAGRRLVVSFDESVLYNIDSFCSEKNGANHIFVLPIL